MTAHGLPRIELGAVVLTGCAHLLFQGLGYKGLYIALASLGWVTYIGWKVWQSPGLWRRWGFRVDNLRASLFWPTLVFLLTMVSMALFAFLSGHEFWSEHLIILLLLYPRMGSASAVFGSGVRSC